MFKKTVVPELQRRLEKGDLPEDVIVVSVTVQNVDFAKLHDNSSALAAFTRALMDNIGENCGPGLAAEHVQPRFTPGSQQIQCVVTPPVGAERPQIIARLQQRIGSKTPAPFAEAIAARLARGEDVSTTLSDPSKPLQVTEVSPPAAKQIFWGDFKVGKKHKVAGNVFKLLEALHVMDDCRGFTEQEKQQLSTQGEEIVWALQKIGELFKEARLEKTFSVLVSNLFKRSRRSCNEWMASLAPGTLQFILTDCPATKDIFAKARGFPRAEIMQYAAECKAVVALAVVASDILQHWTQECSPEDRNFLGEAIEKAENVTWPDFNVPMARGLWDRVAARFIIIDHMVRYGSSKDGQHELGISYLKSSPYDILCSQFKAGWMGNRDASFLYMHTSFKDNMPVHVSDDFIRTIALSHTDSSSQLPVAMKALVEDINLKASDKADCFVTFLSEVRGMGASVTIERVVEAAKKGKPARMEQITLTPPDTLNLELFLLDTVIRDFVNTRGQAGKEEDAALQGQIAADLSLLFEAVLLLSSGDSLSMWAKLKLETDTKVAKDAKRFLSMVGSPHVAKLLKNIAGGKKGYKYDDAQAAAVVSGQKLWQHSNGKSGYFSEQKPDGRNSVDFSQILRHYIRLDVCLEGESLWKFFQALETESGYMASCFGKLAPKGSVLRKSISQDLQKMLNTLQTEELESLLNYAGFFHPSIQAFVRSPGHMEEARNALDSKANPDIAKIAGLTHIIEAIIKINTKKDGPSEHSIQDAVMDICEKCATGPQTWRLIGHLLGAIRAKDWQNEGNEFRLSHFHECAKHILAAGRIIAHKEAAGGSTQLLADTERVIDSFLLNSPPSTWVSSLKSLDTVIFTLEYMGKEDLDLAWQSFEKELKKVPNEQLNELLACAKNIYRQPIVTAEQSQKSMAPGMDVQAFIKSNAPKLPAPVTWQGISFDPQDWTRIVEIVAAAADAMQKKYNVLMLPHHTQMITVLMMGIRACAVNKGALSKSKKFPRTMLGRVGTGEGKSLIIGMLAAFCAKKGLRAHVVNNDRVLTRRDFATNDKFFRALGIKASLDMKDLKNKDAKIVYITGSDIEQQSLDSLVDGEFEQHEFALQDTVLIVDEVDGLIFDGGTTMTKHFPDRELGDMVNEWLTQLRTKGRIERDWDDFRSADDISELLQQEVEDAYAEAAQKVEGRDYTKRGEGMYMLDPETGKVQERAWSLWLEIKKSENNFPTQWVEYKYEKAILSRLQCYMSYSCICGLTGSLGQSAEREYLAKYYEAVTWNVPFFLDTCKQNGKICGKKIPQHIEQMEPLNSVKQQEKRVVELALNKCTEVPVLVVTNGTEAVTRICASLEKKLNKLQEENKGDAHGGKASVSRGGSSSGQVSARGRTPRGSARGEPSGGSSAAPPNVLRLLHNPKKPLEFVELVEKATEPVPGAQDGHQKWPITVTTAEGGRGHDYRVVDPDIDDKGGLLLICTWIPTSEREWIQIVGRTGRQDRNGQYAVFLSADDEQVVEAQKIRTKNQSLVDSMLAYGDMETGKQLKANTGDIVRGQTMHKLTSKFWNKEKGGKTTKRNNWDWKELCREYVDHEPQEIEDRFFKIFPQDKNNGEGLLKRTDGRRYEGGLKDGKPHGFGVFTMPDGTTFEGQWDEGRMHGTGKYIDPSGAQYEGGWVAHEKSGKGTETYPDGARYEGDFLQGCKHGVGKYTTGQGAHYEGQFKKDKMDGHGHWEFVSGHKYTGQWKRGQMNGTGKMVWADGVTYEGRFENDVRHGRGTVKWPDGRVYRGHWHKGRLNGSGVMIDANGEAMPCQNMADGSSGPKGGAAPAPGGGGGTGFSYKAMTAKEEGELCTL